MNWNLEHNAQVTFSNALKKISSGYAFHICRYTCVQIVRSMNTLSLSLIKEVVFYWLILIQSNESLFQREEIRNTGLLGFLIFLVPFGDNNQVVWLFFFFYFDICLSKQTITRIADDFYNLGNVHAQMLCARTYIKIVFTRSSNEISLIWSQKRLN